jgi:hypothetical protein
MTYGAAWHGTVVAAGRPFFVGYLDTDTLQTLYDYGETLPIHSPMRIRITRRSPRLTSRMRTGGARPFWVTGAGATFQ